MSIITLKVTFPGILLCLRHRLLSYLLAPTEPGRSPCSALDMKAWPVWGPLHFWVSLLIEYSYPGSTWCLAQLLLLRLWHFSPKYPIKNCNSLPVPTSLSCIYSHSTYRWMEYLPISLSLATVLSPSLVLPQFLSNLISEYLKIQTLKIFFCLHLLPSDSI